MDGVVSQATPGTASRERDATDGAQGTDATDGVHRGRRQGRRSGSAMPGRAHRESGARDGVLSGSGATDGVAGNMRPRTAPTERNATDGVFVASDAMDGVACSARPWTALSGNAMPRTASSRRGVTQRGVTQRGRAAIDALEAYRRQRFQVDDRIEAMDALRDSARGFVHELRDGKDPIDAIKDAIERIADKLFGLAAGNQAEPGLKLRRQVGRNRGWPSSRAAFPSAWRQEKSTTSVWVVALLTRLIAW